MIPVGFSTADITVTPIIDGLVEGPETVVLTLAADPTYTLGAPNPATVTIADNAPALPVVTVVATAPSAAEGGATGLYTVTRTGSTAAALTVFFTLSGTATPPGVGQDYTLSPSATSITIPIGFPSADITLTPVDDAIAEPTETAILTLSANVNYTIGAPSSATVNIADNEPTVTVTAQVASATEGGGTGTFRVSRTGSTVAALVVNYTLSGTATAPGNPGADYTLSPPASSVTIPIGNSFADITVTAVDDPTAEPTETAILTLSTDPAYTVGAPSNATVNIIDNEPTVTVAAQVASATEGGGTGTFRVSRTGSTVAALVVNYTLSGTATAPGNPGADYTLSPPASSVTIPIGSSFADITVTAVDDPTAEPTETAILTLSTDPGYTVGAPSNATVNIIDNDGVITLTYNTPLQDRVRQANNSQVPDGNLDPTFTVNFPSGFPTKTITSLSLASVGPPNPGGTWNTNGADVFWTLGAANNLASPLLNAGNDSVSFAVGSSSSFVIFRVGVVPGRAVPVGHLPARSIVYVDDRLQQWSIRHC